MSSMQQYPGRVEIYSVRHLTGETETEIKNLVSEINIHSSVNIDSTFCELLVIDHQNYIAKSRMISGDVFILELMYNEKLVDYRFKLRAVNDINNVESGKTYSLRLVSELAYFSYYRKVSRGYEGANSDIALSIFKEQTDAKINIWEQSEGVFSTCIPNWTPIYTLNWLANRSRSFDYPAKFLFFEDSKQRWYFMSSAKLNDIYKEAPVTYKYNGNTLGKDTGAAIIPNSKEQVINILNLDFLNSFDIKRSIEAGSIINTKIRADLTTKQIDVLQNDYWSNYKDSGLNPGSQWKYEDMAPGKVTYEYIASESGTIGGINKNSDETTALPLFDKSQQIDITVEGNDLVDLGQIVNIEIPSQEPESKSKEEILDPRWSGKYYVTAKRDKIDRRKHLMVLRLTKNSQKNKDFD